MIRIALLILKKKYPFLDFKKHTGGAERESKRNTIIFTNINQAIVQEDDRHPGKIKVTLSFCLPSGCYATMLIRQLFYYAISMTAKNEKL